MQHQAYLYNGCIMVNEQINRNNDLKYLQNETFLGDADSASDVEKPFQLLEVRLAELNDELNKLPEDSPKTEQFRLKLNSAYTLLDLDRPDEALEIGQQVFKQAIAKQLWLQAVEACDIIFQVDKKDALPALAHGIWLGVTFPIDAELSVAMLQHLVDESPDRSDGAAVAAATAAYIANLRANDDNREELSFFTNQLLGQVARRHSQVEEQEIFDFWVKQLELDEPNKFLPRLAEVLNILTEGQWWFDRDELRKHIPEDAD